MEADWSVALAAGDPVITVPWAASGDDALQVPVRRSAPGTHLIDEIEEARTRPALRSALLLLNGAESPLWTAKCDAWTSSAEEGNEPFDPYEMDAEPGETAFGAGSYIDLLPRDIGVPIQLRTAGAMDPRGDGEASCHPGERGSGGTCTTPC